MKNQRNLLLQELEKLCFNEQKGPEIQSSSDVISSLLPFLCTKESMVLVVVLNSDFSLKTISPIKAACLFRKNAFNNIFRYVISSCGCAFILCQVRCAKSANPSIRDVTLTEKLKEKAEIIGIPVVDHIIMAQKGFYSFLDAGLCF